MNANVVGVVSLNVKMSLDHRVHCVHLRGRAAYSSLLIIILPYRVTRISYSGWAVASVTARTGVESCGLLGAVLSSLFIRSGE